MRIFFAVLLMLVSLNATTNDVFMILLDNSGSMDEIDYADVRRIDIAKKAIIELVDNIDTKKKNLALMTFGDGCGPSILHADTDNKDKILVTDKVITTTTSGSTPLASSIHQAGEILSNIDKKSTLLILTDGGENCGGNPLEEVKQLLQNTNIQPSIYVIGYNVDSGAKQQLQAIADAGGGDYADASDINSLSDTIYSIAQKEKAVSTNSTKNLPSKELIACAQKNSKTKLPANTTFNDIFDRKTKKLSDFEYLTLKCYSNDFKQTDDAFNKSYVAIRKTKNDAEKNRIKLEGREWLGKRDAWLYAKYQKGSTQYINELVKITNERRMWLEQNEQ